MCDGTDIILYERGNDMEKKVYCVNSQGKQGVTFCKQDAIDYVKNNGGEVWSLSYGYYKDCGFVMDWPTFRMVSDKILEVTE